MPLLSLAHPSKLSITDASSRKPSVLSSCQEQDFLQNRKSWGGKDLKGYTLPGRTRMLDNQALGRIGRATLGWAWSFCPLLLSLLTSLPIPGYLPLVAGVNLAQWLLAVEVSSLGSKPALATHQLSDSK